MWKHSGTLAVVYLFRSFCLSVHVARHNAVYLFDAAKKFGQYFMNNIIQPLLINERIFAESDIVLLEGICILQERCQVFLPGNMRRLSKHSNTTAVNTKSCSILDDVVRECAKKGETTVIPFLNGISEAISSESFDVKDHFRIFMSIKRLAIRRMFELHPLEASPGTLHK